MTVKPFEYTFLLENNNELSPVSYFPYTLKVKFAY